MMTETSTRELNKAIVTRLMSEAWGKGNLGALDELVTPDYIEHSAPPGLPEGRDSLKAQVQIFRTAFPDLQHTTLAVYADGDIVVERWSGGGTHLGPLFGIPPTGHAGEITGIHIFRLAEGQVVEHWGNSDDLGMMRILGVIPG